jgi:phosphoribosyl 1,2-cyclic phosphodiesterase
MSKLDRAMLSVSFRGVRGSTPSPGPSTARYGGNTSCVEVRSGDEILILDAGSGIRALGSDLLAEFGERPIKATLLISHTHWDHIQGLPFFAPAYFAKNQIRVMAAKGNAVTVMRSLQNQMNPMNFPVGLEQMVGLTHVEELASDSEVLGVFRVRVAHLNHPGGCAGFRIETNGGSFAYLPDHEPFDHADVPLDGKSPQARTDALVEFVRGVDLLILDTQYTEAEFPSRRGWGHGRLSDSVAMAVKAGVGRLALFHHDPAHDDDQLDAMAKRARELAGASGLTVNAAIENETVTLGHGAVTAFPSVVSPLAKTGTG